MVTVYYNADGAILGRIGSLICKDVLKGKNVVVINCEKAIVTGSRENILYSISSWKKLGGIGLKGPKVSRVPERLMKRMIRGMLPWNKPKGRAAYDRIMCYSGNGKLKDEEVKKAIKLESTKPLKFITLTEVSKYI